MKSVFFFYLLKFIDFRIILHMCSTCQSGGESSQHSMEQRIWSTLLSELHLITAVNRFQAPQLRVKNSPTLKTKFVTYSIWNFRNISEFLSGYEGIFWHLWRSSHNAFTENPLTQKNKSADLKTPQRHTLARHLVFTPQNFNNRWYIKTVKRIKVRQ